MSMAISRMQFLRGDFRGDRHALRPPWALSEAQFIEQCDRCKRCIDACTQGLLSAGRGGFPVIDFQRGECTFCRACLESCATGALAASEATPPWQLSISISDACLTQKAVICRSCAEQCDSRAIRFRPAAGHVPTPQFTAALCTGCGACIAPCPVAAISMKPIHKPLEVSA